MKEAFQDVKAFMQIGQPEMVSAELHTPVAGGANARLTVVAADLLAGSAFLKAELNPVFKDGRSTATLLGLRLLLEELGETVQAAQQGNLEEFADGLADLIYVTIWTALAHGIDLPAVWAEVQRSNLGKYPECGTCGGKGTIHGEALVSFADFPAAQLCPTCSGLGRVVIRDASGKVQKPPGWTPPDIKGVLARKEKA